MGIALWNISAQRLRTDDSYRDFSASEKSNSGTSQALESSGAPVPQRVLYPDYPSAGDDIGTLSIPALEQQFPIVQGTGDAELKEGVGHFVQSVLPGENDNCVLSGHRDTVFSRLGDLKVGDRLVVKTSAGVFTYAISRIWIVDKDDRTVIVPTDHAVLTVSTCYPFHFVGHAPDRYILSADLVGSRRAGRLPLK